MKQKLHNWLTKKVQSSQWIHKDIASRIKFKRIYLSVLLGIFLCFVGAVALFWLGGLKFDQNAPEPYSKPAANVFLALGIVLFVISTISAIFIGGIYFPLIFKNSKDLYMQTDEYKEKVKEYSNKDLNKFNKKQLKWLLKLNFINKIDLQQATGKKKK